MTAIERFTRGHSPYGVTVPEHRKQNQRLKRLLTEVKNADPTAYIAFFVVAVIAVIIAVAVGATEK